MTAEIPAPGIAVYSATKAYLKSFGRGFSYEMRPFGVKVTTVCPAAIDTGLYPISPSLRKFLRRLGIIRSRDAHGPLHEPRRKAAEMKHFRPLIATALRQDGGDARLGDALPGAGGQGLERKKNTYYQ